MLILFEVVHFEELANFDLRVQAFADWIRKAARPFERFFASFHLNQGVPCDEFLRFGKRSVDDAALRTAVSDSPAFGSWLQSGCIEKHACFCQFLVVR